MPEYLENPRRVPRIAVHCKARLFLPSGAIDTTTEDIGSRGCQVVIPSSVQRGDVIGLALSTPRYPMTLRVDGRVAWVSPSAPFHVGIAYAAQALPGAATWMEGLRQTAPELFQVSGRRSQERLAVDAMIFLGPVPAAPDFREDELVVLRTIGAGVRVGDLRTTLSRTWPRMQRALFTLLARGHVIIARADAAHPVAWKHILGDPLRPSVEADGANGHSVIGDGRPSAIVDPATRITTKIPVATQRLSRRIADGFDGSDEPAPSPRAVTRPGVPAQPPPAAAARTPTPPPRAATPRPVAAAPTPPPLPRHPTPAAPTPARADGHPTPDFQGAGVGWRAAAGQRSAEADNLLKLAMAELEARRAHGALALLRRALSLAPGDAEIASAIGKAMRGEAPPAWDPT